MGLDLSGTERRLENRQIDQVEVKKLGDAALMTDCYYIYISKSFVPVNYTV